MCLIITGPSNKVRSTLLYTDGMIADIFHANADGIGVMYKNKRGLRVAKQLPNSVDQVVRLIDSLPQDDRALAMHWRMRTHGDIDKANCHPYDVVPGKVALMHNGVLHTGNHADRTKSDTWHFINDFLSDPVAKYPGLVHEPKFLDLLADYIDDNRFVFMDDTGRMSIVNRDSGIEVGDLWFSNTYAWSPEMLIPSYRRSSRGYYSGFGWAAAVEDEKHEPVRLVATSEVPAYVVAEFFQSIAMCEVDEASRFLEQWPTSLTRRLLRDYTPTLSSVAARLDDDQISKDERAIIDAVFEPSYLELAKLAVNSPAKVAGVLCYYLDWTPVEQALERLPVETDDEQVAVVPDEYVDFDKECDPFAWSDDGRTVYTGSGKRRVFN